MKVKKLTLLENFFKKTRTSLYETLYSQYTVYVNEQKKTVTLKKGIQSITIFCDKEDKFDWEIGFGLALSRFFSTPKHKMMREMLRNKKRTLDYKTYSKWCIIEFFNGNESFKNNFYKERVKFYESKQNKNK